MPNWVRNEIAFSSRDDLIKAFDKLNHHEAIDNDNFSFEWIIPSPATKEELISDLGEEYICTEEDHLQEDENKPWLNWYKFHCDKWGTKWDACDVNICDSYIYFDTAWSPPEPIIYKLAEILDDIPFSYFFAEEQGGYFCGEYTYDKDGNGSWIDYEQYSDQAYEAYNRLWGDTYIKLRDETWHYGEEDGLFLLNNGDYVYYDRDTKDKDLAKELFAELGKEFGEFLVGAFVSFKDGDIEFKEEGDEEFLKDTIGFYRPCWDNKSADKTAYEIGHNYMFVENLDEAEGYQDSL